MYLMMEADVLMMEVDVMMIEADVRVVEIIYVKNITLYRV